MLSDGLNIYSYDGEGRLHAVNGATSYVYGPEGERVATLQSGAVSAEYLYGTDGTLTTELAPGGKLLRGLLYAGGMHLADYTQDGKTVFHLSDEVGSLVNTIDQTGAAIETCAASPFGESLNCSPSVDYTENHFTDKKRDQESGLDYFGARFYSSTQSRFTSPDPSMKGAVLEVPQTWNKYSYTYNNPLSRADPDGRCPICIGAVVGGVIEGGYDLGKQLYNNGGNLSAVSLGEVGANVVGGAISGALAVATGGASLVENAVVGDIAGGATGNIIGNVVTRALDPSTSSTDVLSVGNVSEDALAGLVGGAGGHIAADMVHIPGEPRMVKTRSGGVYRRQMARNQAATSSRNQAIVNQSARAGITSSLATHSLTGLLNTLPSPSSQQSQSTVTSVECDTLPSGEQRCQ